MCSSAVAATCSTLTITSPMVRKPSDISFGLALCRAGKPLHMFIWPSKEKDSDTSAFSRAEAWQRSTVKNCVNEVIEMICPTPGAFRNMCTCTPVEYINFSFLRVYWHRLQPGRESIYYHGPHELCIIAGGQKNLPLSNYKEERLLLN